MWNINSSFSICSCKHCRRETPWCLPASAASRGSNERRGCRCRRATLASITVYSETDVWLHNAVFISADMIMIKEIKISQSGRSPQELRHQLWELKGLQHDYSAWVSVSLLPAASHQHQQWRTPNAPLCTRARTEFWGCPHLSAEIRSPNKNTVIKDLLSSDLGAHKLDQ